MSEKPFNPRAIRITGAPRLVYNRDGLLNNKPQLRPPSLKVWEDALNRRSVDANPSGQQTELRGGNFNLQTGGSVGADPRLARQAIQSTTGAKKYKLRVEVGDAATLTKLIAASNWDVQVSFNEGAQGANFANPINQQTFVVPRMRIPIVGKVIQLGGDAIYAMIWNATGGNLDTYNIAANIEEGYAIEDYQSFDNNSGGDAPIFDLTHHFSVSVPGGVKVGDNIQVRSPAGVLLQTFPAREGGLYQVHLRGTKARYVPAAGVVSDLSWSFYRTI